jgi:hypothetical protein
MGKRKQTKETFAEMLKELQESSITKSKPIAVIEERKYFLIVCEGEKTEPAYFKYIQKLLPRKLLTTIEIEGEGDNTINVVKRAIELKELRKKSTSPPYDEVWAVFDKDDFPAQRFNQAVRLAEQNDVNSGHSNQSFELWYVLHFQNLQSALHRNDYIALLTTLLGRKYEKNNPKVVEFIFEQGNVTQAIKWAKALQTNCNDRKLTPSKSIPMTMVYELVRRLLIYCKHESATSIPV